VEEIVLAGEPLEIDVDPEARLALQATVFDQRNMAVAAVPLRRRGAGYGASVSGLAPGLYRVVVGGVGATAPLVAEVTSPVLVWDEATA
jgi:hypothetical protein